MAACRRGSESGRSDVQLSVSKRSAAGRRRPGSRGAGGAVRVGGEQQRQRHLAVRRVDHDGGRFDGRDGGADAFARGGVGQIELAQRDDVRGAQLRAQQRVVQRVRLVVASSTHSTVSSGASRQITGSIRLRTMSAGSATPLVSMTMASGRGVAAQQGGERAQQVALQRAADAAIGQADHAVAGAGDQLGVDVDGAEIVDHGGDPPAARHGPAGG